MKKVTIYTDGACLDNPGLGGWSAILIYQDKEKEISGVKENTTNNIMELTAVIEGLKALKESCEVDLYSDSAYVVNAFSQGWLFNWMGNNWKTSNRKPVKNKEIWLELYSLTRIHQVKFLKVQGHGDDEFNNRCDRLARNAIRNYNKSLYGVKF